jgi:hypothetical protein
MTEEQEQQLLTDVALTRQAIMGNGVKGLNERMDEVEQWRDSHPRQCPLEAAPNPRKVNLTNIVLGVVGAAGVLGSLAVAIFK